MARRPVRSVTPSDRTERAIDPALGMRRVAWIRIVVAGSTVRCDAHGIAHRLPCRRPLSLAAALALRDAGVPTVIRTEIPGDQPAPIAEKI